MNHHLIPNWTDAVSETYEFRTTVFTTHSGREQRIAERLTPRRTVNFNTLLWDDRLFAFKALMHDRGAELTSIPDPARYAAVLLADAGIGDTTIIVSAVPWLVENIALAISSNAATEFVYGEELLSVGAFSSDFSDDFTTDQQVQIGLKNPLNQPWAKGTVVRPSILGRLAKSVTMNHVNDRVVTATITLTIDPPTSPPILGAAVPATFNSRPVLLAEPNWMQPPTVTFSTPFEEVDYDRGVTKTFLPVEFYTRITQFSYADRSREDIGSLLSLFNIMRGRQSEFYSPSWTTDMLPSGGIASGSVYLTVVGNRLATTYADSTVEKAVGIRLSDGSWVFRQVVLIVETDESGPGSFSLDYSPDFDADTEGTFSRLQFDAPISTNIYQRDIVMICWLNVCRFASDALTVQWATDDVGQAVAQIMTLEALPPEA